MVERHPPRSLRARALFAGAVAGGLGWAAQHRAVTRATARMQPGHPPDGAGGGVLAFPAGVEHRTVETDDGAAIHVVERGSGPAVVLLHGIGLSAAVWVGQIADLSADHRVVAVDLRGHGASTVGHDGFLSRRPRAGGLSRLAEDLAQVLAALSLERAVVVGHSVGAMVCLQYLHDAGSASVQRRVSALGLVSCGGGPFLAVPGWSRTARVVGALTPAGVLLLDRLGIDVLPSRDLRWWAGRLGFGGDPLPEQVYATEALIRATPVRTLTSLGAAVGLFDIPAALLDVALPMLVVVGRKDRLTPVRHARALVPALGDAHVVVLDGAGHMVMLERRAELSELLADLAATVRTGP